jgi:hypothetical protein
MPRQGSLSGQVTTFRGRRKEVNFYTICPCCADFCDRHHFLRAVSVGLSISDIPLWVGSAERRSLSELHGTRFCAHAPNPTMHRPRVAKTATLNSASIMLPSTESRLSCEELIHRREEIFPVGSNASDDHHSLALLIAGPLVAGPSTSTRATHARHAGRGEDYTWGLYQQTLPTQHNAPFSLARGCATQERGPNAH